MIEERDGPAVAGLGRRVLAFPFIKATQQGFSFGCPFPISGRQQFLAGSGQFIVTA